MNRAGRPRPARLLLVTVAAAVISACAPAHSAKEEISCAWPVPVREPQLCRTVRVDGATYRYALVTKAGATVRDWAIADPGGPGASVLAREGVTGLASASGDDTAIVVLEEPWVTRPAEPPALCREASADYLVAVRGAVPLAAEPVRALKQACADTEYGWTPKRYRAVVLAIGRELNAPVTGFYGASFAAYRLSWLAGLPIAKAALVNPLLPELSPEEVFEHQAAAVTRIGSGSSSSSGSGEVLAAAASQLATARLASLPSLTGMAPNEIASLADAYLGRYGDGRLSPGRIAYFQELCAAGFATEGPTGTDPVHRQLTTLHSGCPQTPEKRAGVRVPNLCVAVSSEDATIPHRRIENLVRVRHKTTGPHSDLTGLSKCR